MSNMGKQSKVLIGFSLIILICHINVTSRRLGPTTLDSLPQDASSLSTLLASHQAQPDLNRTTAHVRPTTTTTTVARAPQVQLAQMNSTHRSRTTIAALNIQAAHNSSRIIAASSQQHASIVASPNAPPPAGSLAAARAKWRQMEQALAGAHSAASVELKRTLEELWLVLAQQERQISGSCKQSLDELAIGLGAQELWASQMLDASAGHRRLPSGLLEGTLTELGNFDECLAISHSNSGGKGKPLRGQYCSVLIKPPLASRPRLHTICRRLPSLSATTQTQANSSNSSLRLLAQHSHQFYYAGLRLGLCLPTRCSQADVHRLLQAYLAKYELVGQVKHCQREPVAEERRANSTTKSQLLDNPIVSSISQNFDLTQQCILFTFLSLAILSVLGTWLDEDGTHERRATTATIMSDLVRNNQRSPPTNSGVLAESTEPRSLAGKRARQYRVCRSSNSTSCCSGDHAAGSSDDDLAREQSGESGANKLGQQRNPLAELAIAQVDLDCVKPRARVESLFSYASVGGRQASRVGAAAMVAGKSGANRTETLPLFLEREQEQLTVAGSISKSHLHDFLICFSLKRNIRSIGKLTTTSNHQRQTTIAGETSGDSASTAMDDLKVVHGLRTLSMIWIIFGHTVGLVSPEMMNNLFPLASLSCTSRLIQAILNTTLAVDTFFMISGLVTVISFVRKCNSARDLIEPPPVASSSKTVWPLSQVAPTDNGDIATADIEVSSVNSSNSAMSSPASSNRCIGLASKSSSQKNFIINKTIRSGEPLSGRQLSPSNNAGWPGDFQPLVWMLLRYLRLTPAYAAIIGLSILMPSLGSGPFWPETVGQLGSTCRSNWWTNLFYVNNFIETDNLCMIHSWYLSNDWQFFLLSLVLFGVFYKSRKLSVILLVGAFVASSVTTFIVTMEHDYPPTIVTTSPAIAERWEFIHALYCKPWPHMPSYLIGLIVGYAILKFQSSKTESWRQRQLCSGDFPLSIGSSTSKLDLAPGSRLLCWLMFSLISFAVLNSIYPWNMGLQVDPILTGLHAATFRTLWATSCGWLVYALVSRPRNPLARVLSWHGFQVSSRLTYCAYLVHPLVIYYHFGTIRERIESSTYGQLHRFMATLIMSYLFAFVVSLLIESPSIRVQKFLIKVFKSTNQNGDDDRPGTRLVCSSSGMHPVGKQKVAQSHGRNKGSAVSNIVQLDYCNPDLPDGCAHRNGHSHDNEIASRSILFAPSVRSRADLSSKPMMREGPISITDPNLVIGKCPHASTLGADRISGYITPKHDAHELSDGGCSSRGSNQSAIDEEFQRKLAQAIGRGFKIRSKIVNQSLYNQRVEAEGSTLQNASWNETLIETSPTKMPFKCVGQLIEDHECVTSPGLESSHNQPFLTTNRRENMLGTFLGANRQS